MGIFRRAQGTVCHSRLLVGQGLLGSLFFLHLQVKGLVIGDYGRRVLSLAGVTDVWSRSKRANHGLLLILPKATYNALIELNKTRITDADRNRLHMKSGRQLIMAIFSY